MKKEEDEKVSECHWWAYRAWPGGLGREQGVNCLIGGEQEDEEGHCPVTYQYESVWGNGVGRKGEWPWVINEKEKIGKRGRKREYCVSTRGTKKGAKEKKRK